MIFFFKHYFHEFKFFLRFVIKNIRTFLKKMFLCSKYSLDIENKYKILFIFILL